MKRLTTLLAIIACGAPLSAQDFPNPKPTEAHQLFANDVGTWDADINMYLQGPDAPATKYKGVETNELVCGGLFSRSTFKSQMGDQEFEGHGLMGYDPRSQSYVGTWVDNLNAVPTQMNGKYDPLQKTFVVLSTVVDGSGQELKQKQTTTNVDESTRTFAIFLLIDAGGETQEIKLMDMTLKKRE
jgi:hypothetical protein